MNYLWRQSKCKRNESRGIALITTLLLMIMLSALATAFVLAVNTENRLQTTDKGSTLAYYGAEAGMEKMMADLNGLYQNQAAPTMCQIQSLGNGPGGCTAASPFPVIPGMLYSEYTFNPTPNPAFPTQPNSYSTTVAAGPNQGLIASVIPMTLDVTAHTINSEEVRMTRSVEVALIPIFQFGVFSSSDLDTFAGPNMDIGGRVQTNGDLFLAAGNGGTTTFLDKLRTAKEVVRDTMANNSPMSTHTGTVQIPTATGGCTGTKPACRNMTYTGPDEGSWLNGTWPDPALPNGNPAGNVNAGWSGISGAAYHGFILSFEDGVKPLNLPFVQPGVSNIEILRRAQPADAPLTTESRLYSKAQIRVLLDDDPTNLCSPQPCSGLGDPNNIRLANVDYSGTWLGYPNFSNGVHVTTLPTAGSNPIVTPAGSTCGGSPSPATCDTFFAEGLMIPQPGPPPGPPLPDANWFGQPNPDIGGTFKDGTTNVVTPGIFPYPPTTTTPTATPQRAPRMPASTSMAAGTQRWNLIDGWLRVEYRRADGTYVPVTLEWLQLGFARGFEPPVTAGSNPVHPNAILIFQQLANRGALTTSDPTGKVPNVLTNTPTALPAGLNADANTHLVYAADGSQASKNPATASSPTTANNFYPINMYDTREGEPRELNENYGCTANGVINLTEIDVGNLKRWLSGATGANGTNVENQSQNGYILYFSDHRGMIPESMAPNAGAPAILGAYGFEDVINPASSTSTPNGVLDGGEDTEAAGDSGSGKLEIYGSANVGLGFGFGIGDLAPASVIGTGAKKADQVFTRVPKCDIGRANWVSGARHGVRLVDGTAGNLPLRPNADVNNVGGFTLASDNPAYVLGDYNASPAGYDSTVNYPHASAAVLADTVTLLSNAWDDLRSFTSPGRTAGSNAVVPNIAARQAADTYYRLAIASGKNVDFTIPAYATGVTPVGQWASGPNDPDVTGKISGVPSDFGTDGGIHNFLRYLETWGGANSYYNGSMVSLYYSEYATGVFKCCGTVYQPPSRHYHFDLDFQNIAEDPPGTPRFQELINVGYKQDLSYR